MIPLQTCFRFLFFFTLDGTSGRCYSFSNHINIIKKSSQKNHKRANAHQIWVSTLPQYEMLRGGLGFYLVPLLSLFFILPTTPPNCSLAIGVRKVFLDGNSWNLVFMPLDAAYCKCQFIFLGMHLGGFRRPALPRSLNGLPLAQAVCLWPDLSACFLWSCHILIQVVHIGSVPLNQLRRVSYRERVQGGGRGWKGTVAAGLVHWHTFFPHQTLEEISSLYFAFLPHSAVPTQ